MSNALIGSLIAFVIMIYSGYEVGQSYQKRAAEQDKVTETLKEWSDNYRGYKESNVRWEQEISSAEGVRDIVDLASRFDISPLQMPAIDSLALDLSSIDEKTQSHRVCIKSEKNLSFELDSVDGVIDTLNSLGERADMELDSITIRRNDKATTPHGVTLQFGTLCVLLRP